MEFAKSQEANSNNAVGGWVFLLFGGLRGHKRHKKRHHPINLCANVSWAADPSGLDIGKRIIGSAGWGRRLSGFSFTLMGFS